MIGLFDQRGGIVAAVLAGVAVLAVALPILSPSASEKLGAVARVHDSASLGDAARALRAGDIAGGVTLAKAYLAAGDTIGAHAVLTRLDREAPGNAVVRRMLADMTPATTAALPGERAMLAGLADAGRATLPQIERLAAIEEAAGDRQAAIDRLANAGGDLSTGGLQRLLRLAVERPDAASIAPIVARLEKRRAPPGWKAVADDLAATGHPAAALALLAMAPASQAPALWRTRFELLRRTDPTAAHAMLAAAADGHAAQPAADLIAAAYAIDRPDMILRAVERGALPAPSPALTLDIARRLATNPSAIGRLDRVAGTQWRQADRWLAWRIAERGGDRTEMLRAAADLPTADADRAREAVLTRFGDRPALRALMLERAARNPADRPKIAEALLAEGDRAGATTLLRKAAAGRAPADPAVRRLLYLWGPRPPRPALDWLLARSRDAATERERLDWLALYADRDRPAQALATLSSGPLAAHDEVLAKRLELAAAARDRAGTERALRGLLDGRSLTPAQLSAATALTAQADPALRLELTRRRVAANAAMRHDRLALAWESLKRGNVGEARTLVQTHLTTNADDAEALRLMADIDGRGGEKRAKPWLRRSLAAGSGDSRDRAAMLGRLGRNGEALAMIGRLRTQAPAEPALVADEARLLVAAGRPGAAQALFVQ